MTESNVRNRVGWSLVLAVGLSLLSQPCFAERFVMTPDDDYSILEGARAGDVVEIQPGTYRFRVFLTADGTEAAPIEIRAADPENPPVWDLSGMRAENFPGSSTRGDRGRGCWQVTGDHVHISGIVLQGCTTSSGNAAGIRALDTDGLVIRDVLFRDNEVGLSGNGENTLVEHCEFDGNGRRSSPPQHNTYIYGGSITMRYNYMHDTRGGQNLHIRAVSSVIEYNWIARASNYEVDIMTNQSDSDAQEMIFRGNVLLTRADPENGGHVFALHNDSNRPGLRMTLRLIGNTILVESGSNPALVNVRDDRLVGAEVEMTNNVVVGTNRILRTREEDRTTIQGMANWLPDGAEDPGLMGTLTGGSPAFRNAGAMDFRPEPTSPLVGAAASGFALTHEIAGEETMPMRFRFRERTMDIGALEHDTEGPTFGAYDDPMMPPMGEDAGADRDAGGIVDAGADSSVVDAGGMMMDAAMDGTVPPTDGGPGADAGAESSGGGCTVGGRPGATLGWHILGLVFARRRRRSS